MNRVCAGSVPIALSQMNLMYKIQTPHRHLAGDKNGRRRIRPCRVKENIRGTQGHNHALGVLALVARATATSHGRNASGGETRWNPENEVVSETRQRNALRLRGQTLKIALGKSGDRPCDVPCFLGGQALESSGG